jgi:GT2 family glycosyltransferase
VIGPSGWHERPTHPSEPIGRRGWLSRVEERPWEGEGGEVERRAAEVDAGIGCCMMYRREDALAAGGYDREYSPVWFDDVDLCLQLRVLGRKAFYIPEVRVIHHFRSRRAPEGRFDRWRPRRVGRALNRRIGPRLPHRVVGAIERRWDIDVRDAHFTKAQCAMLRHHHAYWREKWGWDARNPDMAEIERRWGHTEIWWARDPERRAAGERIVQAYEARRSEPAAASG